MDHYVFRKYAVPEDTMAAIKRYVQDGIAPGDFLQAVIRNDLFNAVGEADESNLDNLPAIVAYFFNKAPSACHGSVRAYQYWVASKGLNGLVVPLNEAER